FSWFYKSIEDSVKPNFYLVPGLEFHLGLKPLKYDTDFDAFVECGVNRDRVLHVYSSSSEFDIKEKNNDSGSELDDDDYNLYGYSSTHFYIRAIFSLCYAILLWRIRCGKFSVNTIFSTKNDKFCWHELSSPVRSKNFNIPTTLFLHILLEIIRCF
ncbi:hypothetical protein Tco_0900458, partial [Tanacetum coccineum]